MSVATFVSIKTRDAWLVQAIMGKWRVPGLMCHGVLKDLRDKVVPNCHIQFYVSERAFLRGQKAAPSPRRRGRTGEAAEWMRSIPQVPLVCGTIPERAGSESGTWLGAVNVWLGCRARLRPVAGLATLTLDGLSRPISNMCFHLATFYKHQL